MSDAVWREETTFSPLDERQRLEPLYLELDVEQARRLALGAIAALERLPPRTEENKWAIADTSPDYYEMSAAMHALAWIGDDVVCERFLTWADREGMSPGWWAVFGGWQLEERPPPRRLTADDSHRLEPVTGESPVRVMVPEDQRCRRCNTVLVALFDLDLTDPRLSGAVRGTRLRVLTCLSCGLAPPFFTTVDSDGGAGWSDLNEPKEGWHEGDVSGFPLPLGLGRAQRTPYEAMAFEDHRSQLFGRPTWVQPPEYPQCPRCEELMLFVGQVDTFSELPLWEGMIFAFVDQECGLAATCYQQT